MCTTCLCHTDTLHSANIVYNEVRVTLSINRGLSLDGPSSLSRRSRNFEYLWMTSERAVRPYYGLFGQSPAFRHEGSRSIPVQTVGFVVDEVTLG